MQNGLRAVSAEIRRQRRHFAKQIRRSESDSDPPCRKFGQRFDCLSGELWDSDLPGARTRSNGQRDDDDVGVSCRGEDIRGVGIARSGVDEERLRRLRQPPPHLALEIGGRARCFRKIADDQENDPRSFVSGLPFGGATGNAATIVDLKLPAYNYVNLSAGVDWDNGLGAMIYVSNLFDENALLSFDRERGGRARLGFNVGQPRVIGITLRKRFGH